MAKKFIVEGKPAKLSQNQTYVKEGDNLSSIAKKLTGDANNWRALAEASGIKNANLIKVGQVITIPKKLYNPVVANVEGKEYRWRDSEYRKLYPNLVGKNNSATLNEITVTNNPVKNAVKKGTHDAGKAIFHTTMNTVDLPRRVIASATNSDYTLKDALNVVGEQPYKSVTGDEFASSNPKTAAAADIVTGLLAWNLPGVVKSISKTGLNLARSQAAIDNAIDATNKLAGSSNKIMSQAAKQSRQNTANVMKNNPGQYEILRITPQSSGQSSTRVTSGTPIRIKEGVRADYRGKGMTGPKYSSGSVGRGKTSSAYTPGTENIGKFEYPIPIATPFKPVLLPIPGLPGYPITPGIPQVRARIESTTNNPITLDEIIRQKGAQEGDTIQLPTGEQIVYKKGDSPVVRKFDRSTTKVYDAANTPKEQYNVPGRTQTIWQNLPVGAGKYIPAVSKSEKRDKGKYYPTLIKGKATIKPL